MLYCWAGMPVVFVIASDWKLRSMVRAELRERGIDALGMRNAAEAGAHIASGTLPSAVVLEACARAGPGLESLARRVPFVVVASAVQGQVWPRAARLLRRPVRIGEIVTAVLEVLRGGPA
ncbi:MAG TPA: hypothetical protein VNJ12_13880 [Candidatus Dormibacteraeota bacterium]|nr:hypothetical protein [Candidatus Dormibacteraeota bacterium]